MDSEGEGVDPKTRRRRESIGGSSDSDLSEGWHVIDETDVTNHDIPSSDGESVEVIDVEDDSRENVTDAEVEGDSQLSPVPDTPLVPLEPERPLFVVEGPHQEEMFDSSFCWFLLFAAASVVVSNLAFFMAQNAFVQNMKSNIEAPSFLRDLPTTPKPIDGNNGNNKFVPNIAWAERDEVMVDVLDDDARRNPESRYYKISQSPENNKKEPYHQPVETNKKHPNEKFNKQTNEKFNKQQSIRFNVDPKEKSFKHLNEESHKDSFNINDHRIGKYFSALSNAATSSETRKKLNQVLFILDALFIGLNDLEEVVMENSELYDVLMKQKYKLSRVLTEVELGVSKSLDRVASNVLNKVQKLERRFEHQWCELERRGHQQELRGLFFECQESKEKVQRNYQTDSNNLESIKYRADATVKEDPKIDITWNNYQVDKDSPGKDDSNIHNNEAKEVDDYYMLIKSDMKNNDEFSKVHVDAKQENVYEEKDSLSNEKNSKSKYTDNKRIDDRNGKREFDDDKWRQYDEKGKHLNEEKYDNEGKYFDGKEKQYDAKAKHYDDVGKKHNNKEKNHNDNGNFYNDKKKQNDNTGKQSNDKEKHYDNEGKHFDNKEKHYTDKGKYYNDKGKRYDDEKKHDDEKDHDRKGQFFDSKSKHYNKRKFSEDKRKHTNKFDTYKTYESKEHHQNYDRPHNREGQAKSEKAFVPNSEPELVSKYLKKSCEQGRSRFSKISNMYEDLKSFIDSKLKVPKKMFDSLYAKYCQVNDESFKWDKRFNRENPKGDFSGKNNKNMLKDGVIIADNLNKNVRVVDISEVNSEEKGTNPAAENIIITNDQPSHWVFSYDESLHDNRSNLTGDWFFKTGESRSKMRWSHHRGDWWFERASHRRNSPQPPHWYSEKSKNWYFRRAWARQNCRHNPHDNWCNFPKDETVTVPNPGFNFI